MTPEFEEALGLWESGDLARDELARRFPDEDVASLLDAFDRMNAASAEPTPDAGVACPPGWRISGEAEARRSASSRPP
jgi:hypothetical protein